MAQQPTDTDADRIIAGLLGELERARARAGRLDVDLTESDDALVTIGVDLVHALLRITELEATIVDLEGQLDEVHAL